MTKTIIKKSASSPFAIRLDHTSLEAAHDARNHVTTLTGLETSIPILIRTALRYLSRHLQEISTGTDTETAELRLKVDILAAAKGIPSF